MVLEHAILQVRDGQEKAFERAMREAEPLIAASPGFEGMAVRASLDRPGRYLLTVSWRAREDHTIGFRQSERYAKWRALLHHFYDPMPAVEYYAAPIVLRE